jgi:membrane-bound ClpP family serine protease
MRHPGGAILFTALVVSGPVAAWSGAQDTAALPASVYVASVDSIIHPVSAEYMIKTMDAADRSHAALVVFTLTTPGGLVDSTRVIVSRMLAAKTPVAVFVSPSGARAASAGFILTIAADVAAMAPGTHIGAAHPVTEGQPADETMVNKMTADMAAYARTLAGGRRRHVAFAEEAVTNSRAFTEKGPGGLAAADRSGRRRSARPARQARRPHDPPVDGTSQTLATAHAAIERLR